MVSKGALWTGRVISALIILFMLFDGAAKIVRFAPYVEGTVKAGFADNLGEEFDAPFARLDWISPNRFDIQWHRHTGAWYRLHRGLSLAAAIETFKSDGHLHPL